jgi:hypothetical protein
MAAVRRSAQSRGSRAGAVIPLDYRNRTPLADVYQRISICTFGR